MKQYRLNIDGRELLAQAMEIGSSTRPRRQWSSQGWGHTRPMHPGRGMRSLMSRNASSKRPLATRPT